MPHTAAAPAPPASAPGFSLDGVPGVSIVVIDAHECVLLLEGELFGGGGAAMVGRPAAEVIPAVIWQALAPRYAEALAGTPQSFPTRPPAARPPIGSSSHPSTSAAPGSRPSWPSSRT